MSDNQLVFLQCNVCDGRPIPRKMLWELKRDHGVKDPTQFVCAQCNAKGFSSREDLVRERKRVEKELESRGFWKCKCGEWCGCDEEFSGFPDQE